MKFTILVEPSLVIITINIVWSVPGSREDDFYKKNAFPPYDLYGPSARTPAQGVIKL